MTYKHLFPMVSVGILTLSTVLSFLFLFVRSLMAPPDRIAPDPPLIVPPPESPRTVIVRVLK